MRQNNSKLPIMTPKIEQRGVEKHQATGIFRVPAVAPKVNRLAQGRSVPSAKQPPHPLGISDALTCIHLILESKQTSPRFAVVLREATNGTADFYQAMRAMSRVQFG
jgi:hypothetical protein